MATLFAANAVFAFSYNVGDSHVFYLPSHLIIGAARRAGDRALRAGPRIRSEPGARRCGAARGLRRRPRLSGFSGARSEPRRAPSAVLAPAHRRRQTPPIAVLLTDLNSADPERSRHFAKVARAGIAAARMPDVLLYAPRS